MKIQYLSDLHLEYRFYNWNIPITNSDIVVLAGDIGIGFDAIKWVGEQYKLHQKPFIYILGNNEYYHQDINFVNEAKRFYSNNKLEIDLLQNNSVIIKGIQFIGSTLWTDFNLNDNADLVIKTINELFGTRKLKHFTAESVLKTHIKSLNYIKNKQYAIDSVVITHHQPTILGIHEKHRDKNLLSATFASNLDYIFESIKPKLWISGHSHYNYDIIIGNTRLIANQHGYPYEWLEDFDPKKIIEV